MDVIVHSRHRCTLHKAGHPKFNSTPPQLNNIADNQINCGVGDKQSCGTAIVDLQNWTSAIPQLSAVSCQFCYFLIPFSQFRMVLKINQKYFRTVCFSGNQKLILKGQLHGIFYLRFFHEPWLDFLKLSSCELEVADIRKKLQFRNCGVAVAEQHLFKKLWNCDWGRVSFKLRNCDCGLKIKLRVPTSDPTGVDELCRFIYTL